MIYRDSVRRSAGILLIAQTRLEGAALIFQLAFVLLAAKLIYPLLSTIHLITAMSAGGMHVGEI